MAIALFGGIILGLIFFGGLQFSVNMINTVKHPAIFMTMSFIIRMLILLIGLYILAQNNFINLLVCSFSVILMKAVLVSRAKNKSPSEQSVKKECD